MAVRSSFQTLLAACGRQFDWTLVREWPIQRPKCGLIKRMVHCSTRSDSLAATGKPKTSRTIKEIAPSLRKR